VEALRDRVEAVRAVAAGLPKPRTAAVEWLDPLFVGGHWIPEMVAIAGGENLLARPGERSRTAEWREIGEARPEVIVHMPCGFGLDHAGTEARGLYDVPELRGAPALETGTVFATDASAYFSRPGPRIVDGLEILAWAIHPEAFPEPAAGRVTRVSAA
jgi:iron complex transport system substrate-binding protein